LFSAQPDDQAASPLGSDAEDENTTTLWVFGSNGLREYDDEYEDLEWPDQPPESPHASSETTAPTDVLEAEETGEGPLLQWPWKACTRSADLSATAYLDWALLYPEPAMPNTAPFRLNTMFPNGSGKEGVVLRGIQDAPVSRLAQVYIVSGIRGLLYG
jgi:hypothetical protein